MQAETERACILPIKREEYDGETLKITVSGLKGGHSGAEIHRGRANADMLLGRILNYVLPICEARIISVDGGLKDNAIPTNAEAIVKTKNPEELKKAVCEISEVIKNDYSSVDGGIVIDVKETASKEKSRKCRLYRKGSCYAVRPPVRTYLNEP